MSGVALRTVRLTNLLSFGPDTEETRLGPLNVLIGPNGSGKSNLIEALSLLKATTHDLLEPIREGGVTREWLWKGAEKPPVAGIDVTVDNPDGDMPLRYRLTLTVEDQRFRLVTEEIEDETASAGYDEDEPRFYSRNRSDGFAFCPSSPWQKSQNGAGFREPDVVYRRSGVGRQFARWRWA
jgi:predicted ATPase